jgi:broad specificity phosphatase PhoE
VIQLVFETHATSTDNEHAVATGWLPGELSERGRREAKQLGERRGDDRIDAVFTSDLRRAIQTAEIAFAATSIPILQDARLRECDYGELNGGPRERVAVERLRRISTPFPGGESYEDAVVRMRSFLGDLERLWDGSRVLLIGHSATRWALEHVLNGTPLAELIEERYEWQPGWEYVIDVR